MDLDHNAFFDPLPLALQLQKPAINDKIPVFNLDKQGSCYLGSFENVWPIALGIDDQRQVKYVNENEKFITENCRPVEGNEFDCLIDAKISIEQKAQIDSINSWLTAVIVSLALTVLLLTQIVPKMILYFTKGFKGFCD